MLFRDSGQIQSRQKVLNTPYSLREIPQLRQLIQQLLQIRIRDLMLQTRNKRLGLLGIIAAQAPFFIVSKPAPYPDTIAQSKTYPAATAQTSPAQYASSATAPQP
jgi:hypothetical protein